MRLSCVGILLLWLADFVLMLPSVIRIGECVNVQREKKEFVEAFKVKS